MQNASPNSTIPMVTAKPAFVGGLQPEAPPESNVVFSDVLADSTDARTSMSEQDVTGNAEQSPDIPVIAALREFGLFSPTLEQPDIDLLPAESAESIDSTTIDTELVGADPAQADQPESMPLAMAFTPENAPKIAKAAPDKTKNAALLSVDLIDTSNNSEPKTAKLPEAVVEGLQAKQTAVSTTDLIVKGRPLNKFSFQPAIANTETLVSQNTHGDLHMPKGESMGQDVNEALNNSSEQDARIKSPMANKGQETTKAMSSFSAPSVLRTAVESLPISTTRQDSNKHLLERAAKPAQSGLGRQEIKASEDHNFGPTLAGNIPIAASERSPSDPPKSIQKVEQAGKPTHEAADEVKEFKLSEPPRLQGSTLPQTNDQIQSTQAHENDKPNINSGVNFDQLTVENIPQVGALQDPASTMLRSERFAHRPELATHVAQQVTDAVRQNPDGKIELSLHPQELGRIKLGLHIQDGSILVSVMAENIDTADLMRRHIDILSQKFSSIGFENISFSFDKRSEGNSAWGNNQGHDEPPAIHAESPQDTLQDVQQETIKIQSNPAASSGLDLRI